MNARSHALARILFVSVVSLLVASGQAATHLMENLGRGVVAVRAADNEVFVSWRVLGTDPTDIAFNIYRSTNSAAPTLLNATPLTGATHFTDTSADFAQSNAYSVAPLIAGVEQPASPAFTLAANSPVQSYLRVPLQRPAAGPDYDYSPGDSSVGDLDGDGEYELIVKWDPSNQQDNSFDGFTGNVYLDAYKLDGTQLWRIDLGRNIRAGAHYTQFIVYDLDGDGRAEIACKTADGTISGTGEIIGDPNADHRGANGKILAGPEFLTLFDGLTGAILATTNYIPPRGNIADWGDTTGNRVDRFLAGVAYLDGRRPSLLMARGYYTRAVVVAWDWREGQLTQRWTFDTGFSGGPYANYQGQGNHNLSIADVDADGRDEIIYGAAAIDDDGRGLYTTGWGHGDALHVSDMDPDRPGLEVWQPHESSGSYGPNGGEFRDAHTGALIFGVQNTSTTSLDVGRGLAADVDPRYRGYEMWASAGTGGMYTAQLSTPNPALGARGVQIAPNKPSINHAIWWDGDLLRELLDGTSITKWQWGATADDPGTLATLLAPPGVESNNGTKANPALQADLFGDWREEVIWRESTNDALRIYTTTIPTQHRLSTLMHDRQYRVAIAWQNVGYNQPPHPSFFLGDSMSAQPTPDIVTSLAALPAIAPAMIASNRYDPTTTATGATSVTFRVTFNDPVTGVDASDFLVTTTGSVVGTVTTVTPLSAVAYNVTVGSITGSGTIRLDLKSSGTDITSTSGTPLASGFTGGQTYNRATLAWINPASGGLWSDATNWDGGVIADGVGAIPTFGNFDVPTDNTVVLDTPRIVSGLNFSDTNTASPASWTIADNGNATNTLTLDAVSGAPVVTVTALGTGVTANLSTTLAGTEGLAKAGAGTLVLSKPATLVGPVNVTAGTLRFAPGSSLAASTVNISAGGGTLDIAGGTFSATGTTTVNGNGGSLIVNDGTATFAAVNGNNSTNNLIRINGGTFNATSINLPRSSDGTPSFNFGFVVTGGTANVSGTVGIGTNNSWGSMSVEGGTLNVGGIITVGNQASGGRGGQLRVLDGTFNATAEGGLVLGARTNNVSRANFTGGTSTIEKITLGLNSTVAAGTATLTLDGGTLFIGSGGIVTAGSGTFTPSIVLNSGVLAARNDWSTAVPITLPADNSIVVHTADAAGKPRNITIDSIIAGDGTLTKTGPGTLTLSAENTFIGAVILNAGSLRIPGRVLGPVVINDSASLNIAASTLELGSNGLTWSGGGSVAVELGATGTSGQLALAGPLTKFGTGVFAFSLQPGDGFAAGNTYTLATFASTNFTVSDFSATGLPPGYAAEFALTDTTLEVTLVGTPFITSANTASGTYNEFFSYTITAGNAPTSFHAAGLPEGLGFDPATGIISGIPPVTGTFAVTISASNLAGTGAAPLTLTIAKAPATLALANLQQSYSGEPISVSTTTAPTDLDVMVTYNGSPTAPTLPGTYEVVATIVDDNYAGSANGTLTITITALLRHAPTLNADIDGSLQVLLAENITLNSSASISGDLLVPGSPRVQLNGNPLYGGTQDATGSVSPTNHTITLNNRAVLRHVVRRVDAIALPTVSTPQAPAGTRNVSLNRATDSPGDFTTLRNLTLNSNAGAITVPPGAYGAFTANGSSSFVFGIPGATEPSVYHLQSLTLNSSTQVQILGPVILRVANTVTVNGGTVGASAQPDWLDLQIANGGLTLNSGATVHGHVTAPNGTVNLNSNTSLHGRIAADRLTLNGNAALIDPDL